jgi:HTH-type transcriptional regulator/antitoxin HigA
MMNIERKKFHPGYYLRQDLTALEMTPVEFSKRTGISEKQVSDLLNEKISLTLPLAEKLSAFFGSSVSLWLGLQTDYDLYQKIQDYHRQIEEDRHLLMSIDKSFRETLILRDETRDPEQEVLEARVQLQVGRLSLLNQNDLYVAYKDVRTQTASPFLKNVWLSLAIKKAREEENLVYREGALLKKIPLFRSYTLTDPKNFYPQLKKDLEEAGIHFSVLPYLPKSNIYGATKWIDNMASPVLALSNRGRSNDVFWFSFFHELSHVLMGHKKNLLDTTLENAQTDLEKEADQKAADFLIPSKDWHFFVSQGSFYPDSINSFALKEGIHPGLVVGRLQKEGLLDPSFHNTLKVTYDPQDFVDHV